MYFKQIYVTIVKTAFEKVVVNWYVFNQHPLSSLLNFMKSHQMSLQSSISCENTNL